MGGISGNAYTYVLTQAGWWIDAQNTTGSANDSNPGTLTLPLLTHTELNRRRRIAANGGPFPILQNTTVIWLSVAASVDSDPIDLDVQPSGVFRIDHIFPAPTAGAASTLTAVTAASGTQCWNLTDTAVASWTKGQALNDTTVSSWSWVTADLGTHKLLSSEPLTKQSTSPNTFGSIGSIGQTTAPATSDLYVLQTLSRVRLGNINVRREPGAGNNRTAALTFTNAQFGVTTASNNKAEAIQISGQYTASEAKVDVVFTQCRFEGPISVFNSYVCLVNCFRSMDLFGFNSKVVEYGGACDTGASVLAPGCIVVRDGWFLEQSQISDAVQGVGNGPLLTVICATQRLGPSCTEPFMATSDGTAFTFQVFFGPTPQVSGTCTHMFRIANGAHAAIDPSLTWVATFPATVTKFCTVDGPTPGAGLTTLYTQTGGVNTIGAADVTATLMDTVIGSGGYGGYALNPKSMSRLQSINQ